MRGYPRGSEWRRWDLHLHTPETKKNDQYSGKTAEEKWDGFYSKIEKYISDGVDSTKNIAVIGITDYLSIDNCPIRHSRLFCTRWNGLTHRDYLVNGSEVHIDIFEDRLVIYSPGGMPDGTKIQERDINTIPSTRRNPVLADILDV